MSSDNMVNADLLEKLTHSLKRYGMRSVLFQQNMAQKIGVTHTDLKTAEILNETGPITAGELSKITGLSTGSVTALIDRLEKSCYVKKGKRSIGWKAGNDCPNARKTRTDQIALSITLYGYQKSMFHL